MARRAAQRGKRGRRRPEREPRSRRAVRRERLSLFTTRRRWRRLGVALGIVSALLAGSAATFYAGLRWFEARPAAGTPGAAVGVSWPDGLDASEAATLLADLGLTDQPAALAVYLRASGAMACIEPGPHLLQRGARPSELVAMLCRKDERPKVKVVIPEGFTRFAIAKRLEELGVVLGDAFLHASADRELLSQLGLPATDLAQANSAEGYLFPATYELPIDSSPAAIVRRLVDESDRRWKRLIERHPGGWERLQAELSWGRREVVVLASIVERETGLSEERPLIASVFLNRLADPEYPHLQSDPTAMYGCLVMPEQVPACAGFSGKATPAINNDKLNPFSTYVVKGLPPGPIANPGDGSLEAVLAPAETNYLFFVASGKGGHEFTETYEQHLEAVKRLRELRK
jgi:UPF0755 protein